MLTSYSQVIDWLLHMPPRDRTQSTQDLQQLRQLLQAQSWYPTCPIVTITGTNGKGSCITTLSAILQAAGYRVGSFTSPHLQRFNERIQVNGQPISDTAFIQAAEQLTAFGERCPSHFFSLLLLMALWYFDTERVDVILLEVGVGGRLDPCNALDACILGITNVALDHQALLGSTRELIAHEKAGLMRPGCLAIFGETMAPLSLQHYANTIKAPLHCLGQAFWHQSHNAAYFHWQGARWCLRHLSAPPLVLSNVSVALAILEALHPRLPLTLKAIRQGLAQVHLAGRYQSIYHQGKHIIVDVAHNPAAIQQLVNQLQHDWPNRNIHIVFGMMKDKDWQTCLNTLLHLAPIRYYLPPLLDPRALASADIGTYLTANKQCYQYCDSDETAFAQASVDAKTTDIILITGSFRLVGAALTWAQQSQVLSEKR